MVSDYLKKVGVDIISCYDLNSSNSQRYNAVRLCVPQCHIKLVMNPDIWPPGGGGPTLEIQATELYCTEIPTTLLLESLCSFSESVTI